MRCPVCGSSQFSPRVDDLIDLDNLNFKVHSTFGVELVKCRECEFLFAAHVHEKTLEKCYRDLGLQAMDNADLTALRVYTAEERREICRQQLEFLSHHADCPLDRRLVFAMGRADVAGEFIDEGASLAIVEMVPSLEVDDRYADRITRFAESDLNDESSVSAFDAVALSNVMERLPNPKFQLRRASRLLEEGGFLLIELPDEMMLAETYGYYGIHHISFFSPKSLRRLVEDEGSFDVVVMNSCNQSLSDLLRTGEFKNQVRSGPVDDGRVIQAVLRNTRPNSDVMSLANNDPEDHLYALGMHCMLLNIHLQNLGQQG